jgi:hypothetical protein
MLLCELCYDNNEYEHFAVILPYFGVAEEYISMQSTEGPIVGLVYASSCLSVFVAVPC